MLLSNSPKHGQNTVTNQNTAITHHAQIRLQPDCHWRRRSRASLPAILPQPTNAKVALIEKDKMGGDCLYTGCVPSKALIAAAKKIAESKDAASFGITYQSPKIDFARIMARVKDVIHTIEPHDSKERYEALGVDCIKGDAHIISPHEVKVNGKVISTRAIIVATGASPLIPPNPGYRSNQLPSPAIPSGI